MAIAFRAAGTAYQPSAGGTDHALETPAGVLVGDLLLACLNKNSQTITYTAPAGEGWTQLPGSPLRPGGYSFHCFYKISDGSEPSTHTFTALTNATQGQMFVHSGVDRTTPLNVTPVTRANVASTTIDIPAITPITLGAWVVRYIGISNATTAGGTISTPSGHTLLTRGAGCGPVQHAGLFGGGLGPLTGEERSHERFSTAHCVDSTLTRRSIFPSKPLFTEVPSR